MRRGFVRVRGFLTGFVPSPHGRGSCGAKPVLTSEPSSPSASSPLCGGLVAEGSAFGPLWCGILGAREREMSGCEAPNTFR